MNNREKKKQEKEKEKEQEKEKEKEHQDKENDEMIGNEILSLRFLNLLVSFIERNVTNYWYSMRQFWSVFEQVLMFDHDYRHYFVNIEFISRLGDFYLREGSPYAKDRHPNEKYIQLKSQPLGAKFTPVIHLIIILIRTCHTTTTFKRHNKAIEQFKKMNLNKGKIKFENGDDINIDTDVDKTKKEDPDLKEIIDLFSLPSTALGYHEKKYSFDNFQCFTLLPISERDNKLPYMENILESNGKCFT